MDKKKPGFTTRQIHAEGHNKPLYAHARPIFQTSTFSFESPEHGAALFAKEIEGHIYTRLGNPTTEALERTLANLESAEDAVVYSSGMAAVEGSLIPFLESGDHIVSGDTLYGPCLHMIGDIFSKWGIKSTFVNTADLDAVEKAITPDTKFCFLETPANPTNRVTDLEAISKLCHKHGVRVIVDNTFATPYNQRPLEHGVDMVMHSATKYLNGHGDVIGGCVIGSKEDMAVVRKYRTDTGPVMSPFDSYLFLRGLKTLSMRMERHNRNGLAVAEFLSKHPAVESVAYPGLPSDPGYEIAKKQMSGFSGMVAFEMKGGFEAAKELLKNTEVIILAVSLGSVDSLIQHPASMTHHAVPKELREQQGLTDGLVRISVGCEDTEDLLADLEQAFAKTKAAVGV
jgi:methionine-gamma-lyase